MVEQVYGDEYNRIMFAISGKPTPIHPPRVTPNTEGSRMIRNILGEIKPYPKKLKTDKQRLKYLETLYLQNEIGDTIFLDLAKLLKVKFQLEELKMKKIIQVI